MLTQLLSHWSSITMADLLTAAYLIILVLFVIGCNHLFTNFVDSKPEGRKTVLGLLFKKPLTLSGAAPSAVSKVRGGHIVPPPAFEGCWGVVVSKLSNNLTSYSD